MPPEFRRPLKPRLLSFLLLFGFAGPGLAQSPPEQSEEQPPAEEETTEDPEVAPRFSETLVVTASRT